MWPPGLHLGMIIQLIKSFRHRAWETCDDAVHTLPGVSRTVREESFGKVITQLFDEFERDAPEE